jgi:anti-sigma factor RsiW
LLAGELSDSEAAAAERHLQECAACRAEMEQQRHLSDLLRDEESLNPSSRFADQVFDRVRLERRAIRFRKGTLLAALALAAVIVFVVFLLRVLSPVAPPSVRSRQTPPPHLPEPGATQQVVQPGPPQKEPPQAAQARPELSPEETELIANLDALEDMELLENYDNLQNLELAVIASNGEGSLQ